MSATQNTILSDTIYSLAKEAGFDLCGIAPYRVLHEHRGRLNEWLSAGFHSGMDYMAREPGKRTDPSILVEDARSIIVCAVNYKNAAWDSNIKHDSGKAASYAFAPDYHKTIKKMLKGMLTRLKEKYPDVRGRCFTDTAPILEKAWAAEAGLGWIGRNSLLVTPQYGSTVLLGELILDMRVDKYDTPFPENRCGKCGKCISACPNSAINGNRTLDTGKCISRITIEKNGDSPDSPSTHGWIFGCDVCQTACPFNERSPYCSNPAFRPVADPSLCGIDYWQDLNEEDFDDTFGKTPLKRSGFANIKSRLP